MRRKGEVTPIAFLIIILIVVIIGIFVIEYTANSAEEIDMGSSSSSKFILSDNGTDTELSPTGEGINSYSFKKNNRTWLNFSTDDYAYLDYNYTISLWFRNSTTNWTHLVNSSGSRNTIYVNGSEDNSWDFFPFYYNESHWVLGKINSSDFVDVEIDSIKIYNEWINETKAEEIYNEGR